MRSGQHPTSQECSFIWPTAHGIVKHPEIWTTSQGVQYENCHKKTLVQMSLLHLATIQKKTETLRQVFALNAQKLSNVMVLPHTV